MLPGGTAVTVKVLPTGLNVWLMGSSVDYNRTTGKVRVHDGVSDTLRKVYVPGFILILLNMFLHIPRCTKCTRKWLD